MKTEYLKLSFLDFILYFPIGVILTIVSLPFYIADFASRFNLFGIEGNEGLAYFPTFFLAPIILIYGLIRRENLKFTLIKADINTEQFIGLTQQLRNEFNWSISEQSESMCIFKTHAGQVTNFWGQQITLKLCKEGLLVNSISDTSKHGSTTFFQNSSNINDLKDFLEQKINR